MLESRDMKGIDDTRSDIKWLYRTFVSGVKGRAGKRQEPATSTANTW